MKHLALFTTLLLVSCTPSQPKPETTPIKIGVIAPVTGGAANYGNDMLHGIELAQKDLNANSGIDSRMIELIVEDGECKGASAAAAAQKLIAVDKVAGIVGGMCSSETLAAAPISNAAQVVQISPGSSSPDITNAGDFVFRVYPSDALKAIAIAQYVQERGYQKVAMISENTDYAVALHNAVLDQLGDNIVFAELMEPDTRDFRTIVTRLKNTDFDLIIPNGQTDAFIGTLMQQVRDQGLAQQAVSQDIADSANLLTLAPEAVEGMQMFNTSSKLGGEKFAERFRTAYGEPQASMTWAALSYDAAGVLSEAIKNAGTDGPAIRDFLYHVNPYQGIVGPFSFDTNGDVVGIPLTLKEFKDGKIVEVQEVQTEAK